MERKHSNPEAGLGGSCEGEDKELSHPFHEQFELAGSCSVYYVHPTAKAKDALIQQKQRSC